MVSRPEWNSAFLEGLFDNMSHAVIVADVRGRFVAVSAAARRLSKTYDPSNPEGWAQHFEVYPVGRADAVRGGGPAAHRRNPRRAYR